MSLDCFKAYDIRGKLGEELNETIAYSIGQATACALEAKNSKPNRAHFDMVIKEMNNVVFDEILHIGDHQINDILFAYNLGIDALWFNNSNTEWTQDFKKPQEFSSWELLPKIIENKYE